MAKVVKANREVLDVNKELEKLETKGKSKKSETSKEKPVTKKTNSKKDKKEKTKTKKRHGIFNYFHEVKVEVSKVKWPSKKDMVKYSVATVVFILFFAMFFYIIDLVFALLKTGV